MASIWVEDGGGGGVGGGYGLRKRYDTMTEPIIAIAITILELAGANCMKDIAGEKKEKDLGQKRVYINKESGRLLLHLILLGVRIYVRT